MDLNQPSCPYPKLLSLSGFTFQVVTCSPVDDTEAVRIATMFLESHRPHERLGRATIAIYSFPDGSAVGIAKALT